MRLIDRVLQHDSQQLWAEVRTTRTSVFATDHGVPAYIGLEYMAQTAAAFFTLQATDATPPKQGMLIACRKYTTNRAHFPLQDRLIIYAQLASRLPADSAGRGLVKFTAQIYIPTEALPADPSLEVLAQLATQQAVTAADLSVFL